MGANDPQGVATFDPRDMVSMIYKEETFATKHCFIQNMKAPGLVVSEKNIFLCFFFHDDPGAGTVWIPGALLAGFIKRTTIRCFTQNMKALGLVVFSHCRSMGDNDPLPCGFGEEDFFYVFPIVSLWELEVH